MSNSIVPTTETQHTLDDNRLRWETSDFTFGISGFRHGNYERQSAEVLYDILFPQPTQSIQRKDPAAKLHKAKFKQIWLIAQLNHYGVEYEVSDSTTVLLTRLGLAVKTGRCDIVPEPIQNIENQLRERWKSAEQNPSLPINLSNKNEENRDEELLKPGQLTDEAEKDIDLFLKKYFLDDHGRPDRNKTPKPIALPGFSDRLAMHRAVEDLGVGLKTVSGGSGKYRSICIGWDNAAIWNLANKIDGRLAERKAAIEVKKQKLTLLAHQQYAASKAGANNGPRPLMLDDLTGSYNIKCNTLSSNYDIVTLTLDILKPDHPLGVEANFKFGILEGIMLLSLSKSDLHKYVTEKNIEDSDSNNGERYHSTNAKRKRAPSDHNQTNKKQKRETIDTNSRKVYLQWRGRETGEGVIELDYHNQNTGVIKFDDSTFTSFTGTWSSELVGQNVVIEGMKVSDQPKQVPEKWNDFSERAYERARVGRWKWR